MERFAFKIDKALRENLCKICRLCGIDSPLMVPILTEEIENNGEEEMEANMHQKIQQLIGFTIAKDDKMPQTICGLCVDKINDFYEFREMCISTNIQTRKLLGLKGDGLKKIKSEPTKVNRKRKIEETIDVKDIPEVKKEDGKINTGQVRKKQRLVPDLSLDQKKQKRAMNNQIKSLDKKLKPKEEIKAEPIENAACCNGLSKLKQLCTICNQSFRTKTILDQHIGKTHLPTIPRYVCIACDETLGKESEIKVHQLWHKLSKTPYLCALCGEGLLSVYAYSRHVRDHNRDVFKGILVLDRECPQCRQTFITNFLYNIHSCAVQTKRCAGCNRQMRNETDYLRHAAGCSKTYINYSKHIPAPAVAAESRVQIKNENDVEAAAAAKQLARNAGISLDMTPVVSLSRLPTPSTMESSQCVIIPRENEADTETQKSEARLTKKANKKGVLEKDLKRVDELLKSTLDALVSIKHEPEVHVDRDEHIASVVDGVNEASTHDQVDDCHNFDDAGEAWQDNHDSDSQESNTAASAAVQANINIKKEVIDVDENAPGEKMPVLKIKIKKEHGTLNSSLVDEEVTKNDKKKKKKKRKELEKERDRQKMLDKNQNLHQTSVAGACDDNATVSTPYPDVIHIKQEQIDADEQTQTQPEATVMTSIPILQFQISNVSSGVEFSKECDKEHVADEEIPDVKPNRLELDRLMQITNVTSGVDMDAEQESTNISEISTADIQDEHTNNIAMGCSAVFIKPEPVNRGYSDEIPVNAECSSQSSAASMVCSPSKSMDNTDYLKNIDFENIQIKKEIEFTETEFSSAKFDTKTVCHDNMPPIKKEIVSDETFYMSNCNDCDNADLGSGDEESNDEDDADEECDNVDGDQSETEYREYRELEMPPPLIVENENAEHQQQQLQCDENEKKGEQQNTTISESPKMDIDKIHSVSDDLQTANNMDFKIISVASNCIEFAFGGDDILPAVNDNTDEDMVKDSETTENKTDDNVCSVIGQVVEQPETTLMAQPFYESPINETTTSTITTTEQNTNHFGVANSDLEEENLGVEMAQQALEDAATNVNTSNIPTDNIEVQQNLLNNEIENAAQSTSSAGENLLLASSSTTTSYCGATVMNNDEETENRINESADAALRHHKEQRQQQEQQQQSFIMHNNLAVNHHAHLLLDDSNINEIAENNNNANIERELQDDNAAERANIERELQDDHAAERANIERELQDDNATERATVEQNSLHHIDSNVNNSAN